MSRFVNMASAAATSHIHRRNLLSFVSPVDHFGSGDVPALAGSTAGVGLLLGVGSGDGCKCFDATYFSASVEAGGKPRPRNF